MHARASLLHQDLGQNEGCVRFSIFNHYNMARWSERVFWLATGRAGKMSPSCPLRISHGGFAKKFSFWPYNRVLKWWCHKNEISEIMGFVRIFWKNNVQEAYLPKMSILGQIVSEIIAQLCLENSIQTLLNVFGVDPSCFIYIKKMAHLSNFVK